MPIPEVIKQSTAEAIKALYGADVPAADITLNVTSKEFDGDFSVVVFVLTKYSKRKPEETANAIGEWLKAHGSVVESFNVIKGFLNLRLSNTVWSDLLQSADQASGFLPRQSPQKIVLEYCGPNTNKPLHLGHIRNMVIGYAMSEILRACGHDVHRVNIYNDRGIAICKSMLAWKRFGNGATPQSSGVKGDVLVGDYYVKFDEEYGKEIAELMAKGMSEGQAEREAPIFKEAQEMLRKWEAGDEETLNLWRMMNGWVYDGFEVTYKRLGVDFEKHYYESEHYLSGKTLVHEGLKSGVFFRKDDGSVWVDLTDEGLDQKVLLRSDGTSVYLTQDLGTAQARYNDYMMDRSIYVVADEQDYHFKTLKLTLQRLGKPFAEGIYHLSYGMVELPEGKMKSREGTKVDADPLISEMEQTAEAHTRELGKIDNFDSDEARELYRILGLGALKFFLLKVHPKKRMVFNPKESVQFHGDTGPFVQYTYARIRSVLRKASLTPTPSHKERGVELHVTERDLLVHFARYSEVIEDAAKQYDPSHLALFLLSLAKSYNRFYTVLSILGAENEQRALRLRLSEVTAMIIHHGMELLGIEVPERM